eukprot:jgi/Chlat1/8208/Chrsp76S07635
MENGSRNGSSNGPLVAEEPSISASLQQQRSNGEAGRHADGPAAASKDWHRTMPHKDLAANGHVVSPPEARPKDIVNEAEMMDNGDHKDMLYTLSSSYKPRDIASIQRSVVNHVEYTLARRRYKFDASNFYLATAHSLRDRLIERWTDTHQYLTKQDAKRVYYLSLEFLVGRSLQNAMYNLGLQQSYAEALLQLGYDLENLVQEEKDPALGNGGLGRLASCFLDSMATLSYPCWGYGIRYKYGMFEQRIVSGKQVEFPDYWLTRGNPWEVERLDVQYPVRFYGYVRTFDDNGRTRFTWEGGELTLAVAYDTPIPGYDTYNTNNMRLWSSKPYSEFDLASFNAGHYYAAIEAKERSESISSVLYPNDNNEGGKELRLKQQFFFVSATLQDILKRYKKRERPLTEFSDKIAIQLNDTHPTIGIPELMRLLLDEEGLEWDDAWNIVTNTYAYTNHTIMPEALERWPVPLVENLLPRHMQIIYEINHRHLQEVARRYPGDVSRLQVMSIIEESSPKMVRMAVLATVACHTVNGVAEIHTGLVKSHLLPEFYEMYPNKFINITNGVTSRRWMLCANPSLSKVITKWLGSDAWTTDLDRLRGLLTHVDNLEFRQEWAASKHQNKLRLRDYILRECGIEVDPHALFDMHIKRIHEYKRQLLNVLAIIHRYHMIKVATAEEKRRLVPHVSIFAGKAAPGYYMAKKVIHFVNSVASVVNEDPDMENLLKVVFIPNYNVSNAEVIIPASDISQHISTAGMEASGTSNMKFVMNGGLILGTMDGANIEIMEEIGEKNMFIFGALASETDELRRSARFREPILDERLQQVFQMIHIGLFGPYTEFQPLIEALLHGNDYYLLCHDFPAYLEAHERVDRAFLQKDDWIRSTIESTAKMGRFSSDRTIREYAESIWHVKPYPYSPEMVTGADGDDSEAP